MVQMRLNEVLSKSGRSSIGRAIEPDTAALHAAGVNSVTRKRKGLSFFLMFDTFLSELHSAVGLGWSEDRFRAMGQRVE